MALCVHTLYQETTEEDHKKQEQLNNKDKEIQEVLQSREREIEELKSKHKEIQELIKSKDQIETLLASKESEIESKDRQFRELLDSKDKEIKDKEKEIERLSTQIKTKQMESQGVSSACRLTIIIYTVMMILHRSLQILNRAAHLQPIASARPTAQGGQSSLKVTKS